MGSKVFVEGRRIGFFGASGCGKSYALKRFLSLQTDWILIDPKQEFIGAPVARSFKDLLSKIKSLQSAGAPIKAIFYPENPAAGSRAIRWIYENAHFPVTIAVDEVQEICPAFTSARDPDNPVIKVSRLGRSRGLSLAVASQRIKTVDISLRANLNSMLLFRQGDFSDAQEIKKMTGRDLFNLPPRAFVWRSERGDLVDYKNVDKIKIWF